MELPVLNDLVALLGAAIVVVLICHRLGIPLIVGLLISGVAIGPHGFGLVTDHHQVEMLAEIGIILLLFVIGLEFSLKKLLEIRRMVLVGGGLQVSLTAAAATGVAHLAGLPLEQAIFVGFVAALSSTAVVLQIVQQRGETNTRHGQSKLGILIFQDIVIVPMLLVIPLLGGGDGDVLGSLAYLALAAVVVGALVYVGARWIVPRLFMLVASTRDQDIFLLFVVFASLGVAWLTSLFELSLALGAFLAGLIISESRYSHQAFGAILPFKKVFTSFFFVSAGMLLDVAVFLERPLFLLGLTAGVIVAKALIAFAVVWLLRLPLRSAILTGLGLAQVGEFGIVMAEPAIRHGIVTDGTYQTMLAVTVLAMAATPFLINAAPRLADRIVAWGPIARRQRAKNGLEEPLDEHRFADHIIVVGYGLNGQKIARAATSQGIPCVVLERNPQTVDAHADGDVPIFFGDATYPAVLEHAGVERARILVLAGSDAASSRRIVELAHRLNPDIYVIVRTRLVDEVQPLFELGADEVVPEEFETAIAMFARVLNQYMVPNETIQEIIFDMRDEGYAFLRKFEVEIPASVDMHDELTRLKTSVLHLPRGCKIAGRTLAELALRQRFGLLVLAIERGDNLITNPGGDDTLAEGDKIVLFGRAHDIAHFVAETYPQARPKERAAEEAAAS